MDIRDLKNYKNLSKNDKKFILVLVVFALASFIYYYEGRMNIQNITAYLFSYRYGFVPRGLIGSLLDVICSVANITLTYRKMKFVSLFATMVYYLALFYLFYLVMIKSHWDILAKEIMFFAAIVCFPMFLTWNNFGRLDEYLTIFTLLCLICLFMEKAEWLVAVLMLLSCLTHVGFVFTNSGLLFAILLYKLFSKEGKDKKKYIVLTIICILICGVCFLYTEICSSAISMDNYNVIVSKAKELASQSNNLPNFNDAYSLLNSELLKQDVYNNEQVWRIKNWVEAPIFIVLFSPYIVLIAKVFSRVVKSQEDIRGKIKYLALALGVLTIVPELILKVDYGRWMFCIVFYYAMIFLFLLSNNDATVMDEIEKEKTFIKSKIGFPQMLVVYPLLFVPFRDVYISDMTTRIMDCVARILGLW